MQTLGAAPLRREIPVTKGCGFTFTVTLTDPATGAAVAYDGTVRMDIDVAGTPTTVDATIAASVATIALTPTLCDQVGCTTRWRVINTTTDGTETPLVIGAFQRYD